MFVVGGGTLGCPVGLGGLGVDGRSLMLLILNTTRQLGYLVDRQIQHVNIKTASIIGAKIQYGVCRKLDSARRLLSTERETLASAQAET